jgi:hypothetical protein
LGHHRAQDGGVVRWEGLLVHLAVADYMDGFAFSQERWVSAFFGFA